MNGVQTRENCTLERFYADPMGHSINGVVASAESLPTIADRHGLALAPLDLGLAFMPTGPDELDVICAPSATADAQFIYLSDTVLSALKAWSASGPIAYIETDYFGGVGTQSAITIDRGAVVCRQAEACRGAINGALRKLGVGHGPATDAFEAVGLHRYRSNECAIDAAVEIADPCPMLPHDGPARLSAAQRQFLATLYANPRRAYHNLGHIADVLHHYRDVALERGWRAPREVWLAALYHDAVYVAGCADNEAKSADIAADQIARWLPDDDVDVDRVRTLIELTACHGRLAQADVDAEAALFLDCDMAILAAPPAQFDAYQDAIADEYRSVASASDFRAGRAEFLAALLSRSYIYLSARFHGAMDGPARANLRRALAALSTCSN